MVCFPSPWLSSSGSRSVPPPPIARPPLAGRPSAAVAGAGGGRRSEGSRANATRVKQMGGVVSRSVAPLLEGQGWPLGHP